MRLVHKLYLAVLVVALLIWRVGELRTSIAEQIFIEQLSRSTEAFSQNTLSQLFRFITHGVSQWQGFSSTQSVIDELERSNSDFAKRPKIQAEIDRIDQVWRETDHETPLKVADQISNSLLSRDMLRLQQQDQDYFGNTVFGEVFITNRFGVVVAQTNRTSDYRQDDEAWWKEAFSTGIFVGDLAFDTSAGVYSLSIAFRTHNSDGQPSGVIKLVFNLVHLGRMLSDQSAMLRHIAQNELLLFSNDGKVVYRTGKYFDPLSDGAATLEGFELGPQFGLNSRLRRDPESGKELFSTLVSSVDRDWGLGWKLLLEYDADQILVPVQNLRLRTNRMNTFAIFLALAFGVLFVFSIVRRLNLLRRAAQQVGRGKYDLEIDVSGRDEISDLAKALAYMTREVRELTARLRSEKSRAEDAEQTKGRFLANMSHEVRTPLNGILGMTELALSSELSDEQREYLEAVRSSGQSLLLLVNDVLDMSKIEADKFGLSDRPFSLLELLDQLEQVFRPTAEAEQLEFEIKSSLVPQSQVLGDDVRLMQVLTNLVSNAIKFTPKGGRVSLELSTEDRETGVNCVFRVSDTGIGVPEEKQGSIFEPFIQADLSTSRRFGGTGLGLSIAASIVELMGEKLKVKSTVGQGTEFSFSVLLPRADRSETGGRGSPDSVDPIIFGHGKTILIGEDNRVNQRLLSVILERLGFNVLLADDGASVLQVHAQSPADLILMDLQMPEVDGFAALQEIRAFDRRRGCSTPIIAVTAQVGASAEAIYLAQGFDGYVGKPINHTQLFQQIAALVPETNGPNESKTAATS